MKQKLNTFTTPVHLACGTDELRPAMELVAFKNGFLYATDAKILIRQKLSIHNLDEGSLDGKFIHRGIMVQLLKYNCIFEPDHILAFTPFGKVKFPYAVDDITGDLISGAQVSLFSKIDEIITGSISNFNNQSVNNYNQIGIAPALIRTLLKVMLYSNHLVFNFSSCTKAVIVTDMEHTITEQVAILMPSMIYNYPVKL